MAELSEWSRLLQTYVLALFWGAVTSAGLMVSIIKAGPRSFFSWKERTERPAVLNDDSLGEHKMAKLDGINLHYVESGSADKPLMLFVHGFPECWYSWRHQIRHFAHHYRVVALDMRGYGESDRPGQVSDYHMDNLTGDLKQLITHLGYSSCILVAHDWGGAVASMFTQKYPAMVSRLVMCNIPHNKAFQKHVQSNFGQLLKSWYIFMFQLPFLPELMLRSEDYKSVDIFKIKAEGASHIPCTEEELEVYKYSLSQPGSLTGMINYYRAAMRYKPMHIQDPIIKVPTLMVWGKQDKYLDSKMAELSADYHTDFKLEYIPTASHWVMMDEPELVNQAIETFLHGRPLKNL